MSKNCGLPDYAEYHFSLKEGLLAFLEGTVLVAMIGYFFYHSWIACVALIPVFVLFIREKKKDLAKKRRQELSLEFKDLVLALSANMKAGYSVENALGESCRDVELLYGADSPVCREVRHMLRGMEKTAAASEQKIEVDKEIQLMISAKKMEQKIMNFVPFLIIFYIGTTSRGFFDVLYHNLIGIAVMTVCLGFYGVAYLLSKRIVEIEV